MDNPLPSIACFIKKNDSSTKSFSFGQDSTQSFPSYAQRQDRHSRLPSMGTFLSSLRNEPGQHRDNYVNSIHDVPRRSDFDDNLMVSDNTRRLCDTDDPYINDTSMKRDSKDLHNKVLINEKEVMDFGENCTYLTDDGLRWRQGVIVPQTVNSSKFGEACDFENNILTTINSYQHYETSHSKRKHENGGVTLNNTDVDLNLNLSALQSQMVVDSSHTFEYLCVQKSQNENWKLNEEKDAAIIEKMVPNVLEPSRTCLSNIGLAKEDDYLHVLRLPNQTAFYVPTSDTVEYGQNIEKSYMPTYKTMCEGTLGNLISCSDEIQDMNGNETLDNNESILTTHLAIPHNARQAVVNTACTNDYTYTQLCSLSEQTFQNQELQMEDSCPHTNIGEITSLHTSPQQQTLYLDTGEDSLSNENEIRPTSAATSLNSTSPIPESNQINAMNFELEMMNSPDDRTTVSPPNNIARPVSASSDILCDGIPDDLIPELLSSKDKKNSSTYIALISRAIFSSPEKKMLLSDIYDYMSKRYKLDTLNSQAWRNSVRHNLSLNECFVKHKRLGGGRGHFWSIHPACVDDFVRGDFRRRQARRLAQRDTMKGGGRSNRSANSSSN